MEQVGFSTGCLYRSGWSIEDKISFLLKFGNENLEISFLERNELIGFEPSKKLLDLAGKFKRVSVHAPAMAMRYGNNLETQSVLEELVQLSAKISISGFVVHPDTVDDFSLLEKTGLPFLMENMDSRKKAYRFPEEIRKLRDNYNFAFLLDTQHTYENDKTMALGFELIDVMGDKLEQMHVSGHSLRESHYPLHRADNRYAISKFLISAPIVPKIAEGVLVEKLRFTAGLEYNYLSKQYIDAVLR